MADKMTPGTREAGKTKRRAAIVGTARRMIAESGKAGFSLVELARRAGVSPATPYNLVGPRTAVLEEIVREEFEAFRRRLSPTEEMSGVDCILAATRLVTAHYGAEPDFYRGLFGAMNTEGGEELRYLMLSMGRDLWERFIAQATDQGEIDVKFDSDLLTDQLLAAVSGATLAWIMERWSVPRFAAEMRYAVYIVLCAVASKRSFRPARRGLLAAQGALVRLRRRAGAGETRKRR